MEIKDEEWELVNDDGFVYKRLKRHPTITTAPPPPDPAAEERNRKKRKKTTLLQIKTSYQHEIQNWEQLSNTLKALHPQPIVLPDLPVPLSTDHSSDSSYQQIAETLMVQVEAQEAFINEVSALCDAAESLCNAQEQLLKQPLFYLAIWESSPRKLIASLCEE